MTEQEFGEKELHTITRLNEEAASGNHPAFLVDLLNDAATLLVQSRHPSALAALKAGDVVMVPEVKFSAFVYGNRVRFSVDQQSFTLDYEPDTAEELYWMRDRLDAALSKIAAAPEVQAGEKDNAGGNSAGTALSCQSGEPKANVS